MPGSNSSSTIMLTQRMCCGALQGSARVIRCLQSQQEKLSAACMSTLFSQMVQFSESIDFQYPMKQSCAQEIGQFCSDVPHSGARVIRCLQVTATCNSPSKSQMFENNSTHVVACHQEFRSVTGHANADRSQAAAWPEHVWHPQACLQDSVWALLSVAVDNALIV